MNFEDERYVRLYVRDTVTWKLLKWQGKCLLPLLLRKVDRAGCADLDGAGIEGVAALAEIPLEVVEPGFQQLLERGVVEVRGDTLIFPKFMAAQEAKQSDKVRQQESRARKRDTVLRRDSVTERDSQSQTVTSGHESQQNVTAGHAVSHDVTPYRTVLCSAQPSSEPNGSVAMTSSRSPLSVGLSGQSEPSREPQQGALIPEELASPKPAPERNRKPRKARPAKDSPDTTARTNPVWEAYSAAYLQEHGALPTRNRMINGQLADFLGRVPADEAPAIAAFYARHPDAWLRKNFHPIGALLKNAEGYRTEWLRGRQVTMTEARQREQTSSNAAFRELERRRLARAAAAAPESVPLRVEDDDGNR